MFQDAPDASSALPPVSPPSPCCGAAWNDNGACVRCGLTQGDIAALMAPVFTLYERARESALAGDFATVRRFLSDARAAGLPFDLMDHAPLRLDALSAAAEGNWAALLGGNDAASLRNALPPEVRDLIADPARVAVLAADNARSRRFAAEGKFDAALVFADECAQAAPFWAGGRDLQRLCAAGAGLQDAATPPLAAPQPDIVAAVAEAGEAAVPRSTEPNRGARPRAARRRSSPIRREKKSLVRNREAIEGPEAARTKRTQTVFALTLPRVLPLMAAVLSLAACGAAAVALRAASSPRSADAALPQAATHKDEGERVKDEGGKQAKPAAKGPGTSSFIPHPSSFSSSPPPSEADARRLFNLAVAAKRAGLWAEAARLAESAHARAGSTYLTDESLLLWAQASDNEGTHSASAIAAQYRRIADETPCSPYAPLALRQAARAAKRAGRADDAARDKARLRAVYGD